MDEPCVFQVEIHDSNGKADEVDMATKILEKLRDYAKRELGIEEKEFDEMLVQSLFVCGDGRNSEQKEVRLQIYISKWTFGSRYDLVSFLARWKQFLYQNHDHTIEKFFAPTAQYPHFAKTPDCEFTRYPYHPSPSSSFVPSVPVDAYEPEKRDEPYAEKKCEWCTRPLYLNNVRVCFNTDTRKRFHLCKACVDGEYQLPAVYKHMPTLDTFEYRPYVYFHRRTKWDLRTIRDTVGSTQLTRWWDQS